MFSLAAGVSEYFDNTWYVAAPMYSLALLDGFGRMGHDAHWLSDVVGAALLGWGTTELLLYLHARHAEEPSRWRILPMGPPAGLPDDRNLGLHRLRRSLFVVIPVGVWQFTRCSPSGASGLILSAVVWCQ